jgi:hypothetical protein
MGRLQHLNTGVLVKMYKRDGYFFIVVNQKGKIKCADVHRLVAEAFCPNPNKNNVVDHKDRDRSNNQALNLHWVTQKTKHSKPFANKKCKVIQKCLKGNVI